jgi:hypothetical protein
MAERNYMHPDVERCLKFGTHNQALDELKVGSWRYRIQGKTIDGRNIDLAVAIDDDVIVVTVIDPDQ